jgi:hypothetical protein
MRMRTRVLVALAMMAGGACEAEHGKGGFIDRAMAKDLRENAPRACEQGKAWRRSSRAPADCKRVDDPRMECKLDCFGPDE